MINDTLKVRALELANGKSECLHKVEETYRLYIKLLSENFFEKVAVEEIQQDTSEEGEELLPQMSVTAFSKLRNARVKILYMDVGTNSVTYTWDGHEFDTTLDTLDEVTISHY